MKSQTQLNREQELAGQIARLRTSAKLDSWTSFVEELQVPADIAPALITGRPELLRIATPRPLTTDECGVLYKLIAGLVETNAALREHASDLAKFTDDMLGAFSAVYRTAEKIKTFANFKVAHSVDQEESST